MYHFAYLYLTLPFVALALALLSRVGRDLRRVALLLGTVGGAAGVISEYFYFHDYWRPPTLFGVGHVSVEDFLFGSSVMIVSVLVYPVFWQQRLSSDRSVSLKKGMAITGLCIIVAMLVGNRWLGVNSILVSSGAFAVIAACMVCRRNDLLKPAIATACFLVAMTLLVYVVEFDGFLPDFWSRYWLLHGTRLGGEVFGNVPLTELLWYFCWGLLGGAYLPFLSGRKFQKDNRL